MIAAGLAAWHFRAVDHDRDGPGAVRNKLAARTNADWLLPLDDDDLIDADYLDVMLPHCEDADVVYSWCRVEDHGEGLEPWSPNRLFTPETLLHYNYIPVTALYSHAIWDRVGGMPAAGEVEDHKFHLRLLAAGARYRCVDQQLWTYRRGISGSRNEWVDNVAA